VPDRYRQLFLTLGDAVFVEDARGAIADANTAAAWLLGAPVQELVGRRLQEFLTPGSVERYVAQRETLKQIERTQFDAQLLAAGQTTVNVILDISSVPAEAQAGAAEDVYLVVARESSKRDELERELRLVRQSAGAGYGDTVQSSFFVSSRQEISRYPPLVAGEKPRPLDWVAALIAGPRLKPFLERAWKDEEIHLPPAWHSPAADIPQVAPAASGEEAGGGARGLRGEGLAAQRWLRIAFLPLRVRGADVTDICVRVRDETAVRLAAEQQFWQDQRVSAELLREALFHDLNNYLSVIMAQASALKLSSQPGHLPPSGVGAILDAAQEAAGALRGVGGGMAAGVGAQRPVNLNALIPDCATVLAHLAKGRCSIETELDPTLPAVTGDDVLLKMMIVAFGRGMEAVLPPGSRLSLKTFRFQPVVAGVPSSAGLSIGRGAGPGDSGYVSLDESGKRTPEVALARAILRVHRGHLEVVSSPSQGSFWEITLPGVSEPVAPAGKSPAAPEPPEVVAGAAVGRILLADDEENFRLFTGWALRERGYDVITAKDGQEAFERFQEAPESFKLVILDAYMPRMGGLEAYLRMQILRPELPVLFASGFARGPSVDALVSGCPGPAGVLLKPFSVEDLDAAVRKALAPR
jgi:PAS domain S-box-containing protein